MKDIVDGKKYFLATYGCQMNEHDSEVIEAFMEQLNYHPASSPTDAGVIILNTCCVRENADQKVYGRLGEFLRLKRKNPELIIIVCGCLAQKDGERLIKRFPHVDLVLGTYNLSRFPLLLSEVEKGRKPLVEVSKLQARAEDSLPIKRRSKVSCWIPISFGCNNFCSFCIVPFVRGRQRSREASLLFEQAENAVREGCKEIILLGQNVNAYGQDLDEGLTFINLLETLNRIEGLERIRFTSSHPRDFSEEMVQKIAGLDKVCEHFHLPLQSGDNHILKKMNRGYTREDYFRLVERIRAVIPGASITTDLIVGFPGETEAQFSNTLSAVEEIRFDQAFMFAYSIRDGTSAARMKDHIASEIKMSRLYRLINLTNRIVQETNSKLVGEIEEVLVEGTSPKNPAKLCGRTRTNKIVVFEGEDKDIGELKRVRIFKSHIWGLEGMLVSEE